MRATTSNDTDEMVRGIVAGERRVVAHALRLLDDDVRVGRDLAVRLQPHLRGAQVLGVTGSPGAGKSTLVDAIVAAWRTQGRLVAVLAIDPSSPFSGGAILGDRIRMSRHAVDTGVFIRSLATRGALGGVSRTTAESTRVLDAAGFDAILIETVGVGQDEVAVARLAETTLVVMMPGAGDDVQAIKAGLLEVADVMVINKADRDGVPELERALRQNQSLAAPRSAWQPPIVRTVATSGEGLDALLAAIGRHRDFTRTQSGRELAATRSRDLFETLLDAGLVDQGRLRLGERLGAARRRVSEAGGDPYVEVATLLGASPPGENP